MEANVLQLHAVEHSLFYTLHSAGVYLRHSD